MPIVVGMIFVVLGLQIYSDPVLRSLKYGLIDFGGKHKLIGVAFAIFGVASLLSGLSSILKGGNSNPPKKK